MNKGVFRFALLVAGATFFLIIAGALVTSHDAGLATADWPLTDGHFLPKVTIFGITTSGVNMVGNLFWEHGHRMIATTVGFLTILLVIFLFVREKRRWVRRLGVVALIGVVLQGLLGGLTVKLMLPLAVSSAHATLAQLFFCTTVALAVFTSRSWQEQRPTIEEPPGVSLRYLCATAAALILVQLVVGATLRHSATWDKPLPTSLLLAHIAGAIIVTAILGSAAVKVLQRHKGERFLTRPATVALGLLVLQLMLGVGAYLVRSASPNDPQPLKSMVAVTVAHVACGALVFATTIVLTLRCFRVLRSREASLKFKVSGSEFGVQA